MSAIYKLSIISIVAIIVSCSKQPPIINPPTVSTISASAITNTSATLGGNITNDGGSTITERGIFLGKEQNPETTGEKWGLTGTNNSFSGTKSGLIPNTTYYAKAYATNEKGTGYGNQITFTTTASIATIVTTEVTGITVSTAESGGIISNDGGVTISSKGVCWSKSQNPTIENNKTSDGTGRGSFTSSLTGLTANTTYYIRAYATNIIGVAYGAQFSFTTSKDYVEIGGLKWAIQDVSRLREFENAYNILYMYSWNLCDEDLFDGGIYDQNAENSAVWEDSHNPCPTGWRLPTSSEFTTLVSNIKSIIINEYIDGNKFKGTGAFSFNNSSETLTLSMIPSTEFHTAYDEYYRPYYVNDKRLFQYWTKNSESQHYAYALNTSAGKETLAVRRLLKRNHCFVRCIKE